MYSLEIKRVFACSVERLYQAWASGEQVETWFAPGDMTVPEASVDFRKNGRYRIVMQDPAGEQHIVGGEYLDIAENENIVFTWCWEGSGVTTKVAVHFLALDASNSELTLEHTEFTDEALKDKHGMGWNACLANLETAVGR